MKAKKTILSARKGDITTYPVDAIVNAANTSLRPGGGVCGAIYSKAGPDLVVETDSLLCCATGKAVISKGYSLPAKFIIHAVGPIYTDGETCEEILLESCYKSVLILAHKAKAKTIAFPAISTGIYGYPIKEATMIAIKTCINFTLEFPKAFKEIHFVCFSDKDLEIYEEVLKNALITA